MTLGHVAFEGTQVNANASRHKATGYDRMKKREAKLQAEVDRWLAAAEAADAEEDKLHGADLGTRPQRRPPPMWAILGKMPVLGVPYLWGRLSGPICRLGRLQS